MKAGAILTKEAIEQANRRPALSALPPLTCDGCRACCMGDAVALQASDVPTAYKTKMIAGVRYLATKGDDCVYLGKGGCQIHNRKPHACRVYDCRQHAWAVLHLPQEFQAGRVDRASVQSGLSKLMALGVDVHHVMSTVD